MTVDPPRRVKLSFVAVIVVACAVTTLLAYDISQNRHAIKVMAADQRAFDRFRAERAALTTQTDAKLCAAENSTRRVERRRVLRDFGNLDRNLRLLHIQKTPEIVRIARHDRDVNVAALKPLKCKQLPTATAGANPPNP